VKPLSLGAGSERGCWIRTAASSSCSSRNRESGRYESHGLAREDNVHGRALRARGIASVSEYIDLLSTPQKDIAAQLRALIRTHYPRLGEDIKWYVPVYSLGTVPIVSIEGFKAHVNLKFFEVARLQDWEGILEGTGKGVRHVKFRSTEDVEEGKDPGAHR
jgi:hypothetical protein